MARNDRSKHWSWSSNQVANQRGWNEVGHGAFDNRYPALSRPSQTGDRTPKSRFPIPPSPVHGGISEVDRLQAVGRWDALPEKSVEEEAKQRNSYRQNHLARESEESLTGVKRAHQVQPRIVETWKRVKLRDGHGNVNREFVGVQMVQHGGLDATGPRETVVGEVPAPTRNSHRRQVHNPPLPSRSVRKFPPPRPAQLR